ncbi:MAG: adenylosuccinate lyase, partial [Acidisphaera sp.]|nr:adenylosuccinate lyase [Acidisphaera sp.]
LALTRAGFSREDAYRIVQGHAMASWADLEATPRSAAGRRFRERLEADPEVAERVSPAALAAAMDARMHLQALDAVFARVFGEPGPAAPPS